MEFFVAVNHNCVYIIYLFLAILNKKFINFIGHNEN